MKTKLDWRLGAFLEGAALTILLCLAGCAFNGPTFRETSSVRDGETNTVRELRVRSFALWPATQDMAKQKASMGKTWSLGIEGLREDGGGTNMVGALRELNQMLDKIK